MSDGLFGPTDRAIESDPELVTMVAVAVYDRGPSVDRAERYEAELAGYGAVREAGASPWASVCALVGEHRTLLERRWAPGGPAT